MSVGNKILTTVCACTTNDIKILLMFRIFITARPIITCVYPECYVFSAFRTLLVDTRYRHRLQILAVSSPTYTLMVHAHTVVSILWPTLIIEQEH